MVFNRAKAFSPSQPPVVIFFCQKNSFFGEYVSARFHSLPVYKRALPVYKLGFLHARFQT
jgi:hypothetical protein